MSFVGYSVGGIMKGYHLFLLISFFWCVQAVSAIKKSEKIDLDSFSFLSSREELGCQSYNDFAHVFRKAILKKNKKAIEKFYKLFELMRLSDSQINKVMKEKINKLGKNGKTVLHRVVSRYHEDGTRSKDSWFKLEVMKKLMVCGADIKVLDDKKRIPLHHAAKKGMAQAARFLLNTISGTKKRCEYFGMTDKYGMTFLHYLVCFCSRDTFKVLELIQVFRDFLITGFKREDNEDCTAKEVFDLLIKPDKRGFTACEYAYKFNKQVVYGALCDVAKELLKKIKGDG